MGFFIFISVIGIAVILTAVSIYFTHRTHKKDLQKRDLRRYFADKLKDTPLPRMLQSLGIGGSSFIHRTPIDSIGECIKYCENCTETEQCKEKIKIPELNPEDIEFCPNKKFLSKFSRSQRIKG